MTSLNDPSENVDYALVLGEALDAVLDVQQWELTEARWVAVTEVLGSMRSALASGDRSALAYATTDLELMGPLRILRIGATGPVSAPRALSDGLAGLADSLRRELAREIASSTDPTGGDDDRAV